MAIRSLKSGSFSRSTQVGNSIILPGDYESIATTTVGAGGSSTITFSSIPSTYKHLQIRGIAKSNRTGSARNDLLIKLNGSSSSYAQHQLYGNGTSAAALGTASTTNGIAGINVVPSADYTSQFGTTIIDILEYTSTNINKTIRALSGTDNNGAGFVSLNSSLWYATPAAVTSIDLTIDGSYNFVQYSSFALYGIRG